MSLRRAIITTWAAFGPAVNAQFDPWTSWSVTPPMSIQTLWIPDSQPRSLEASLKSVHRVEPPEPRETVEYYEVSCPKAASPENDACRAAGIYPAEIYHTVGPIWGGTTTYPVDDSTTTWRCSPGLCTKTIVSGGSSRTETETYDSCYVLAHHVPMVVTEGAHLLPSEHYLDFYNDVDASDVAALQSSNLVSAGCPSSKTTMFAGAVATTDAGSGEDGSTSSSSSATETGSGSASRSAEGSPTASGGDAESSEDAGSSGPRISAGTPGLVSVGFAVAACYYAVL